MGGINKMSTNNTDKVIKTLNSVSSDLHDLTLEAVFSKTLLDERKKQSIFNIKKNICVASSDIEKIRAFDATMAKALNSIVNDCISSLREIHVNMKKDMIKQEAEDDYAELSAQITYLKYQIDKMIDS